MQLSDGVVMEWILLTLWPMFVDLALPHEPPLPCLETEPDATDLFLTRLTYEFMAAETTCSGCHARLGRGLYLLVVPGGPSLAWRIDVVARCHGWRRHRYATSVTQSAAGLYFTALRRT